MIAVENVTKYYGSHPAVRDLDFNIEEGECVGFLGLNGAGKSTTLKLLSCLLLPTSGRVTIRGIDAEDDPHEIRKFIGFLPDKPPVYPEMTVHGFLRFAGRLRRMDKARIEQRLPEVLDVCDLADVADQPIGTLSHGYQQRVGIAQAIIHDPALLILDEPIQGLDPVQIVEMRAMIRGLRGKHTILLSTHNLPEVEQTCDRILMLHRGRMTAQGTEDELIQRYGEGTMIELLVRGTEAQVQEVLASVDDILDRGFFPADELGPAGAPSRQDKAVVRVRVRAQKDVREEIAKRVVEAGLGLLRLELVATGGLEGIFVRLSKDAPDDSIAPPGKRENDVDARSDRSPNVNSDKDSQS